MLSNFLIFNLFLVTCFSQILVYANIGDPEYVKDPSTAKKSSVLNQILLQALCIWILMLYSFFVYRWPRIFLQFDSHLIAILAAVMQPHAYIASPKIIDFSTHIFILILTASLILTQERALSNVLLYTVASVLILNRLG